MSGSIYIQSKIRKLQHNFHSYWKKYTGSPIEIIDSANYEDIHEYEYHNSNGIMIYDGKSIYICAPYIDNINSTETIGYIKHKDKLCKTKLIKQKDIVEFNISIYKMDSRASGLEKHCINIKDVADDINVGMNNLSIQFCQLSRIINNLQICDKTFNTISKSIVCKYLVSTQLPEIPCYEIKIDRNINDHIINGSLIKHDTKIVGMTIMRSRNGDVIGIPLSFVKYLIQLYNLDTDINKLNSVLIDYEMKTINNNPDENMMYIKDNYSLKGNKTIPKNIYLSKINNEKINKDGHIYSEKYGCNMKINTYYLLHNDIQNISGDVVYNTEKSTKAKINIMPYNYKKYMSVLISENEKCVIVQGLVFIELHEDMMDISGLKSKDMYNIEGRKHFMLIDILDDKVNDSIKNMYVEEDLRSPTFAAKLHKINNQKINNFNDIENIKLDEEFKIQLVDIINDDKKIVLKY